MNHASLFSGIGGFDLAAEWMGWENKFHCEWNEFCKKVLKYYWPNAISYGDIDTTDFTIWRGLIDVLSGGFPCQPYSAAGKRKGKEDERHKWPEMLRAIKEIQPSWVVGENVSGLLNWNGGMVLHEIKTDLEGAGFEVFPPCVLPACGKDAPHKRERLWIIAHVRGTGRDAESREQPRYGESVLPTTEKGVITDTLSVGNGIGQVPHEKSIGQEFNYPGKIRDATDTGLQRQEEYEKQATGIEQRSKKYASNTGNQGLQGSEINGSIGSIGENRNEQFAGLLQPNWQEFPTQPPLCSGNDGIQSELAGITVSKHRTESIKAYGNSVVPQVVFEIFKAIEQYEKNKFD